MKDLKGKVVIVTGGSRGVGKGIALGLAEAGATIYVTGRTTNDINLPDFLKGTTIYNTVEEVNTLGGLGIAYKCDHSKDEEVKKLFDTVLEKEGRLDILVNNAWAGGAHIMGGYFFNTPFWEQPISLWDDNYTVGVRSNYIASKYAAKIMSEQKSGLIINISYYGGRRYFNNVAYGVCKAAVDKLSADTAYELKEYGVSVFSLYPGTVSTEGMIEATKYDSSIKLEEMESPIFVGRCISALAMDEKIIEESGKILITAEVGEKYGIKDIDGKQPKSQREMLWS